VLILGVNLSLFVNPWHQNDQALCFSQLLFCGFYLLHFLHNGLNVAVVVFSVVFSGGLD